MRFVQFVFSHSFFVALCAVALCFETALLLGLNHAPYLYAFVFFATLGSYNFHCLMGAFHASGGNFVAVYRQHRIVVSLIKLSGVAMLLLLPQLWHIAPYIALAVVATALYSLVLLPIKPMVWLRRAGFVKTILLALTWTYVTAFLPLQKGFGDLQPIETVFIVQRFCLILQLSLLFDVRDTAIDKIKGLHSLATDISPAATKAVLGILSIAYLAHAGYLTILLQRPLLGLAFFCVQLAALALLRVPVAKRSYFYYYFLVDGLMLLSALLTALVHFWLV